MIIYYSLSPTQALVFVACAKKARMIIGSWTVYLPMYGSQKKVEFVGETFEAFENFEQKFGNQ